MLVKKPGDTLAPSEGPGKVAYDSQFVPSKAATNQPAVNAP